MQDYFCVSRILLFKSLYIGDWGVRYLYTFWSGNLIILKNSSIFLARLFLLVSKLKYNFRI